MRHDHQAPFAPVPPIEVKLLDGTTWRFRDATHTAFQIHVVYAPVTLPGYKRPARALEAKLPEALANRGNVGALINGTWTNSELPGSHNQSNQVSRPRFPPTKQSGLKAEPGTITFMSHHSCRQARRTLIYLALRKLDGLILVAYAVPGLDRQGWTLRKTIRGFPDCTRTR